MQTLHFYAECHYCDCRYTLCRGANGVSSCKKMVQNFNSFVAELRRDWGCQSPKLSKAGAYPSGAPFGTPLGHKVSPGTKALAYFVPLSATKKKKVLWHWKLSQSYKSFYGDVTHSWYKLERFVIENIFVWLVWHKLTCKEKEWVNLVLTNLYCCNLASAV